MSDLILFYQLKATTATAEWTQPTYLEVFTSIKTRSGGWGHPVGVRAAADWTLCPALPVPQNAADVVCDSSTCAVVCELGFQADKYSCFELKFS